MLRRIIAVVALVVGFSAYAMAALTPEELAQLGGDKLTAIGAEVAGSSDGLVPPYTGGLGLDAVPKGFDRNTMTLPNPFAEEKPLYSISANNMEQYADKLTAATKHLIKKYEDFRIDVYPTHRTIAIPGYVAEGTKKSAATAKLENDGITLKDAFCGIPFPIPKNGLEAVWNHLVRWAAPGEELKNYRSFLTTSSGRRIMTTESTAFCQYPYWDPNGTWKRDYTWMGVDYVTGPANRNGERLMWYSPMDKTQGEPAWQYLPGQRRIKMAPEISYDTPNVTVAGASTYDDCWIYQGCPDRYNWKILGKKEIFVPYNCYRQLYYSTPEELLGPQHVNPDLVRWELHRVWVVEGQLKEDKRHVYKRRTLYLDEDSWIAITADEYDKSDELYRGTFSCYVYNYDTQAPYTFTYYGYDFVTEIYWYNLFITPPNIFMTIRSESEWSPQGLAGSGIR